MIGLRVFIFLATFPSRQVASPLLAPHVGTLARVCRCRAPKNFSVPLMERKTPRPSTRTKGNMSYAIAVTTKLTNSFRTQRCLSSVFTSPSHGGAIGHRTAQGWVYQLTVDIVMPRLVTFFTLRSVFVVMCVMWARRLAPQVMPFLLYVSLSIPAAINSFLILCIDLGTEIGPALSFAWEAAEVCE